MCFVLARNCAVQDRAVSFKYMCLLPRVVIGATSRINMQLLRAPQTISIRTRYPLDSITPIVCGNFLGSFQKPQTARCFATIKTMEAASAGVAAEVESLRAQIAQLEVAHGSIYLDMNIRGNYIQVLGAMPSRPGSNSAACWHALQVTLKLKEKELDTVYPYSRSYGKTSVVTILGSEDGGRKLVRTVTP